MVVDSSKRPKVAAYVLRVILLASGWMLPAAVQADRLAEYRMPDTIPFPADNPYSTEKASLGKMLFFDMRLSRNRNISCASCHSPSFGWEVPFAGAIGAGGKPLRRHAPTLLNLAWTPALYWDGRSPSLEAQAKGPITSAGSMNLSMPDLQDRLSTIVGYRDAFSLAFDEAGITESTILAAIATYERTLVSGDSPFDRWVDGDAAALGDSARRGFELFTGRAGCSGCHTGWKFSDDGFHDIGLAVTTSASGEQDIGLAARTGRDDDRMAFKTPGLRDIARRAPFMHDGSIATLSAVIDHYVGGGVPRASRSSLMRPLSLDGNERRDLLAFLQSLSSDRTSVVLPTLPVE